MAHLIDKDALVAEIERLQKEHISKEYCDEAGLVLIELDDFIDTLEVKELDLELNSFDATVCKIGSTYLKDMDKDAIVKALESYKDGDKVKVIIVKEN